MSVFIAETGYLSVAGKGVYLLRKQTKDLAETAERKRENSKDPEKADD
jgi:hypothetical protein